MFGWKKGLVAFVTLATLVGITPTEARAAPAAAHRDSQDWEAPLVMERQANAVSIQGLFDDDPTGLVPKTPFVQRYSLDVDHWEVWLCGATTRTLAQTITDLEAAAVDYFDAVSGGIYQPTFSAGGSKPLDDDGNCAPEFLDGTYVTVGTPEGVLIIDAVTGGGYASPGTICLNTTPDCTSISSTFPGNRRYAVVGEYTLTRFPSVAVHELGHTLQWPHSNSGASEYDNPIDLMSGNSTLGGWTEAKPYASLSYNRLQSGWVSPEDVVVADGSYQAATLQPFDVAGTQLFAIKTALAGKFYVFGARKTSTYDPIPTEWQGVEVYEIDYYCSEPAFGGGICPGIYRDTTQEPPNPDQVLHVLTPGESVVLEGLTVTVTGATATGYTITSDSDPGVDTEPSAPGRPTVDAADEQAAISWIAAGDGGSSILNYDLEVENRSAGGSGITDIGDTLSTVVSDLSNGTTYRARVRATNAIGDGPWSAWSSDFVPAAVPSAPGGPTVGGGDTTISASWAEPSDSGGLPITNYEVELNNQTDATTVYRDAGSSLSTNLTALANGDAYRVRVRAENATGSGAWSGWSSSVVPSTVPGAPQLPTVTVTTATSADASWVQPASDGGLGLLGYELVLENRTSAAAWTYDPGLATAFSLSGLTSGDTYRYRVRTNNSDGWGMWSVWSPDFIPGTVPAAPGVPELTAGNAQISAMWVAAGGIGSAVDQYGLELDDMTADSVTAHDVGATLSYVFGSVTNGEDYRVRVRAHNDSGWGPWSGWSSVATPLAPPNTFVDDDGSVFEGDIEWLAGRAITKGCNPPVGDRFCPEDLVTRGQMAAFLVRALGLSDDGGGNMFVDDDGSVFEVDIAKLATAGITRGCNPPANDRFCPDDPVTRGQMAAFLNRALG